MKCFHLVAAMLCLLTISCSTASTESYNVNTADSTAVASNDIQLSKAKVEEPAAVVDTSATTETVFNNAPPPATIEWDKKIIKTANIEASCEDYALFNQKLHALVKLHGGWIAAENETQENNTMSNSVEIKIPVSQFDDLVSGVGEIKGKIISKTINTQDVTGEVVDAEGRVKVKKALRDKYIAMLGQASKMQDVITVQEKIDEIHEEIEMNATRAESLKHQAAFSTVNIHYYQAIGTDVQEDQTPGFLHRLINAITGGANWIGDVVISMAGIWPLLLLVIGIIWVVKKQILKPAVTTQQKTKEE